MRMARLRTGNQSDEIRNHAERVYVRPALARHAKRFSINVGDVHKGLYLHNRVPLVCAALKSEKFLHKNGLRLVDVSGPPSGQSTTVTLTYEFEPRAEAASTDILTNARGVAREVFRKLGGGERFIRAERATFSEMPLPSQRSEQSK